MKLNKLASALIASGLMFSAVAAQAADPVTVTGSVAFTSDYLFRGVSQTSNNSAIQGALTATHTSGVYVSAWSSSIANASGGQELDLLLGYSGKSGDLAYDMGVMRYAYPGANAGNYGFEPDYNEVYASVSAYGAKFGVNYSDDYFAESGKFTYVFASYGKEVAGFGLFASAGLNMFEGSNEMNQAIGTSGVEDSFADYKVAVSKSFSGVTLEAAYIGSTIDDADISNGIAEGRPVVTLSKAF